VTKGSRKIKVAIVDTGIDYNHPDLKANVWTNEAELNGVAGVDDDGNGYADDVHGWNFVSASAPPQDDNKHGTHVAGIIGARGGNGDGIAGVAWNVSLMPVKILDALGQTTLEKAIEGVNYVAEMGRRGQVQVMNNSWGGTVFSKLMFEAFGKVRDAGVIVVCAAGNSSADSDKKKHYPVGFDLDNIIAVAAIDNTGALAKFSNFGVESVDVAAPGKNIYSTFPRTLSEWDVSYIHLSGTSMAAPHVAGRKHIFYAGRVFSFNGFGIAAFIALHIQST
jgi:subtilisin family serine protease